MAVPQSTPSLAWLNNAALSPKERLAMNKATVNPIPPSKLIPARFAQVMPLVKVDNLHLMANQVNR